MAKAPKSEVALFAWIRAQPKPWHTQTALARHLGINVSTLNDILHGRKTPSLTLALKIESVTGIPPKTFSREASE
jgi:DNA-binding XRE family transcriptional regulator